MTRDIDTTTLLIGLCVLGGAVILLNAALIAGYRSINSKRLGSSLQKSIRVVRNPWHEEDASLEELSRQVDDLTHRSKDTPPNPDDPE